MLNPNALIKKVAFLVSDSSSDDERVRRQESESAALSRKARMPFEVIVEVRPLKERETILRTSNGSAAALRDAATKFRSELWNQLLTDNPLYKKLP